MLHRALTINMPRISHVSKESMISATETEQEEADESPGGERGPYEQGQPSESLAVRKVPDDCQSIDREEFKIGRDKFSITPHDKRIRYVKSDASMVLNVNNTRRSMQIKPFRM